MTLKKSEQLLGNSALSTVDRTFSAMGTHVTIALCASNEAIAQQDIDFAKEEIEKFERRFSRFLPNSELSRLNNSNGEAFLASAEMIKILESARQWNLETKGIFDPSVIESLEYFGYDKSLNFQDGPIQTEKNPTVDVDTYRESFIHRNHFADIQIYKKSEAIILPKGLRVDLGGIGKGYIVDVIVKKLAHKYDNFWVSAGGDMYLHGKNISGEPWQVNVQDPFNLESDIGNIVMARKESMAVATSGIMKRKGTKGDFEWHHIINPETGLPAKTGIVAVTVIAPTVVEADICAKTALILGKEKGIAFINARKNCECIVIDSEGSSILSKGMQEVFIPYI